MRSSLPSYRSLFILYGASALVLLPFGGGYAYACLRGWDKQNALIIFLALGVIAALSVWAVLEPRLIASQPAKVNVDVIVPQVFARLPSPQLAAAVGVFVFFTCSPTPLGKATTVARGSVGPFKIAVVGEGQQLSSGTVANIARA